MTNVIDLTLSPDGLVDSHFVYVLRCADGTLYTGYTVHMPRRLRAHQAGTASKYTRARLPVVLVGAWSFGDRRSALQAEYAFKQLSRQAKERHLLESEAERPPGA